MSLQPTPSPRRGRRRAAGVAAALALGALALVLAGCGGSSGSGERVASAEDAAATQSTATSTTAALSAEEREEAMLEFAKCMRAEGVDFPDPTTDANGNLRFRPPAANRIDRDTLQAAMDACRRYMPAGGPGNMTAEQRAAFQDAALKFAQCMRTEGIDMPDPQVDGEGGGIRQALAAGVDPSDPTFQAAQATCEHFIRDVMPAGGPGGAPPPGAGGAPPAAGGN